MIVQYTSTFTLDAALLQWYARLIQDGELATLLAARFHPVGAFLRFFQPPNLLRLEIDPAAPIEHAMKAAMWYSPMLDGAVVGTYIAPEWRRSRAMMRFGIEGLAWGFTRWPVLIGWTRNPHRARTYQKFGFRLSGAVPNGQAGQTMWMLTLTAEQLAPRVERMARYAMARPAMAVDR